MIRPCDLPVLITSAINVSASQTKLGNSNDRLESTIESLQKWLSIPSVKKIVICDGSGFDLNEKIYFIKLANPKVEIEVLCFKNDTAKVIEYGKGYGEGEIINYALAKSKILMDADFFVKCTGKLWVENFDDCVFKFNGFASFDYTGLLKPERIDTRFYIINKKYYLNKLADVYQKVNDRNGFYLEHAFRDGLLELKLSQYVMCPTPKIKGMSGSMGVNHYKGKLKTIFRDIRSFLVKGLKI